MRVRGEVQVYGYGGGVAWMSVRAERVVRTAIPWAARAVRTAIPWAARVVREAARALAGRGGGAGGRRLAGLSLLLGGGALVVLGLMVVVTGTGLSGALGMRVETFGRIDCRDTRTQKGQTVRHCFGESPAQQRANRAELKQVDLEMLRAHLDGVPRTPELVRTRILFADHDGRTDPDTVTATQVFDGGRWYAHSSTLVGYGMIPLLLGRRRRPGAATGCVGGEKARVRGSRAVAGSGPRGRMVSCSGLPGAAARVWAVSPKTLAPPLPLR